MNTEISLTLPDTVLEQAQLWAKHSGRPLDAFLAEAIELSLQPFGIAPKELDEWSNDEVLKASEIQLSAGDEARLSELLDRQRESLLSANEAAQLQQLMVLYQQGLLLKAMATQEAVKRGLKTPPQP
jgi:hypothetical protein